MSKGENPGEIFAANAHRSYFMSFIYITHLTKIPTRKLFSLTPMEKSKAEKSPWVKKTKKTGPKKNEKAPYCQGKKKQKTLPKATKALGLAKRLRLSRHLLKIRSVQISLEQEALKSKSTSVQAANKILRRNLAEAMKKMKPTEGNSFQH